MSSHAGLRKPDWQDCLTRDDKHNEIQETGWWEIRKVEEFSWPQRWLVRCSASSSVRTGALDPSKLGSAQRSATLIVRRREATPHTRNTEHPYLGAQWAPSAPQPVAVAQLHPLRSNLINTPPPCGCVVVPRDKAWQWESHHYPCMMFKGWGGRGTCCRVPGAMAAQTAGQSRGLRCQVVAFQANCSLERELKQHCAPSRTPG